MWDAQYFEHRLAVAARPQNLVVVNKGVGDRGFLVCPDCGRTEPVFGPGFPYSVLMQGGTPRRHHHPLEVGVFCDARAVGPYYLGHRFPTDVLLLRLRFAAPVVCPTTDTPGRSGRPGRTALTSLVEAIALAGSRILQIDEGELAGNWSPVLGGGENEVYMFLYDLLPGGAGYTRLVRDHIEQVLEATEVLLAGCDCESSCYRCLRHYGNNFDHPSLDRRLALALLRYLKNGQQPALSQHERQEALTWLLQLARLKELHASQDAPRNGVIVPLVITRDDGSEVWVDVHHPLVDAHAAPSLVQATAESHFVEFCPLDTFTLRHDLPRAYGALQL